ncbi:MAG TPA: four helix bundle protein [Clostridia bacterium]|nr:four helix bundle protein [Clostridia bacterium]
MADFKKLAVWQKAHDLTLELYRATSKFPSSELYGLTSQVRRAASSIGANLAEGCGRGCDGDLARHISIATGSASELEYHLLLARDLGFITANDHVRLGAGLREVGRMLAALSRNVAGRRPTKAVAR